MDNYFFSVITKQGKRVNMKLIITLLCVEPFKTLWLLIKSLNKDIFDISNILINTLGTIKKTFIST